MVVTKVSLLSEFNLSVEAGDTFDFESLRLDWMRLQVFYHMTVQFSSKVNSQILALIGITPFTIIQ